MVETLTKRLSLLASLLFLPGMFFLSWRAWEGFNDDVATERHRIQHYEQLAAFHVVNNLGIELFHLDFTFRLAIGKADREGVTDWPRQIESIIGQYREEAHYPGLLADVLLVSDPPQGPRGWRAWSSDGWQPTSRPAWVSKDRALFDQPADPLIDLEDPVLLVELPTRHGQRQVLLLHYDVDLILKVVVPALAKNAFEDKRSRLLFTFAVTRQTPAASMTDRTVDLTVPLVPRARFSGWLRSYLDRSPEPPVELEDGRVPPEANPDPQPRWALQVKLLPDGLADHAARLRERNLWWALGIFGALGAGFVLFLLSVLRLVRAARREKAFSSLVSHELKTPVAAIRSLSENLSAGVVADGAKVREYGSLIVEQTQRLGEMIGNILALSTLDAGGQRTREEFDLGDLVRESAAGLGLNVADPGGSWAVRGNRAAVRAALDNLLTNALRYGTRDGQRPEVEVTLLRHQHAGRRWAGVSVADHGPGVDRSELSGLFEPYRRGRRAQAQQIPGGGIGLSLVRATMKHLKGRVQVRTVPGGGLRFVLWLKEGRQP